MDAALDNMQPFGFPVYNAGDVIRDLLKDPDLLLLDEPTNHLDLHTIEWLEGYLKKQSVPMVIISHDIAFLDQLCTKIVETDMGVSRTYEGNYSQYVISKAEWIETQLAAWEKQQKDIDQTKDLISRLSTGANAGRASTAEKKLGKLQDQEQIDKPFIRKQMKIRFPERGRSGKSVLSIKNLEFNYEDKVLFRKANLTIERGEKIAILGPNGCGKSTLLKLVMDLKKPNNGEVLLGEHNVLPNYFEQIDPGGEFKFSAIFPVGYNLYFPFLFIYNFNKKTIKKWLIFMLLL